MMKGTQSRERLSREDWLQAALETMRSAGIDGVKLVPLARRLGVTTGSFYWHFKNRRELHDALLEYWEREMTDAVIDAANAFAGSPRERIWRLMEQVMTAGLASLDLALWHWAQTDTGARRAFKRVLKKRFEFAARTFSQAGFSDEQAEVRGRMMVVYMMGESTLVSGPMAKRKKNLKLKHAILTAPE